MRSHPVDTMQLVLPSEVRAPPEAEHPRLLCSTKVRRGWHAFACHDGPFELRRPARAMTLNMGLA